MCGHDARCKRHRADGASNGESDTTILWVYSLLTLTQGVRKCQENMRRQLTYGCVCVCRIEQWGYINIQQANALIEITF